MSNAKPPSYYMFLPLNLALRASCLGAGVQFLAHGLAGWAVWLSAATPQLCILGDAAVAISLAWQIRRRPVLEALKVGKSTLQVMRAGEWTEATLEHAHVSALLTVMRLHVGGRRINAVLWPDSVETEGLRRLRVWLGWGRQAADLRSHTRPSARRMFRGRSGRGAD